MSSAGGAAASSPREERADRALKGGEPGTAGEAVASSVSTRRIDENSMGGNEGARARGSTGSTGAAVPPPPHAALAEAATEKS
jgi:hypothetical protein